MDLQIFDKDTRNRVDLIRTYNYVQYTDEYNGRGKFEIVIPTNETSLKYITYGTYIYFEKGIVGIVKSIKDTEDSDFEITISGYLVNHILEYRSFLLTTKYYDKIENIAFQMVNDLFVNPEDKRRKIDFVTLSKESQYKPESEKKVTVQDTGDTLFSVLEKLLPEYNLGFELYPVITNYDSENPNSNLSALEFRLTLPYDKTINNKAGNNPIVFSFDLNNLSSLEYEEDGRDYNSVAVVAAYGRGEDRKVIEVGDTSKTGIDRIELYVDARDIQEDDEEITDDELEELMEQRGLEQLQDHIKFITVDGTIVTGSMQYRYGVDFKKGFWVSVYSKKMNRVYDLQITSVTKTLNNGVEIFDIGFGQDRLRIHKLNERKL